MQMISPLSGSDDCTLIKNIDAKRIASRWREELGVDWVPTKSAEEIQYWVDNRSGFCFYTPASAAGDESLYLQLQKFPWYYMEEKWEFRYALQLLRKYRLNGKPNVLEVGVGRGAFLKQAQAYDNDISGVELNSEGAQAARCIGFTIFEQDLKSIGTNLAESFDAVCAFQVLEHLPNPKNFLEEALALLKQDGFLILSVPNSEVACRLDPGRNDLLDQPPHHMTHWSKDAFYFLEKILPVRVADVAFEPLAVYHIDWFIGSWLKAFEASAGSYARRILFNRLSLPLLKKLLALGGRKLVKGHTLLVCLQKK